jgi:hypothetical protein
MQYEESKISFNMTLLDEKEENNFPFYDKVDGNILVESHVPKKIIDVTKDNNNIYY